MDKRLITIASHYGKNHQTLKLIEEMAELTQALIKGNEVQIAEEMADVVILLKQQFFLRDNFDLIHHFQEMKIERQLGRMGNE